MFIMFHLCLLFGFIRTYSGSYGIIKYDLLVFIRFYSSSVLFMRGYSHLFGFICVYVIVMFIMFLFCFFRFIQVYWFGIGWVSLGLFGFS